MSSRPAPPLVLASASPRRARLLAMLGLEHVADPAEVAEDVRPDETPEEHVERLARAKASAVARRQPGALVLAGDTVVVADGRIVGKPSGPADAVDTLLALAGRTHEVMTGIALAVPTHSPASFRLLSRTDVARVRFRPFGRPLAEAYVATGEPLDKAGSYGIQGLGAALVTRVEGDYYTVVGLPVSGLVALLDRAGYRYAFSTLEPHPERP